MGENQLCRGWGSSECPLSSYLPPGKIPDLVAPSLALSEPHGKKWLKFWCTCPETEKARGVCVIEKVEKFWRHLIETHEECVRALGFKI